MRGIFVDIENELTDIGREIEMLSSALAIFQGRSADVDPAWSWLAVQGLASGVDKIYTGCERVMAMIASDIDGARIEHGEGWHISLLKRMAHPFPDVRSAVISDETYRALDQLRSFRHRERNTYGLVLDTEIVVERANQTTLGFRQFKAELTAFTASMSTAESAEDAGSDNAASN